MRHAVILAGGSGTRLWPASRKDRPKQFLALTGTEPLLTAAVRRARTATTDVTVVTAADQAALVTATCPDVEIVAEPMGRNTAAALGLAAVYLIHRDPEAVMAALPADHHIGDERRFADVLDRGFSAAERNDVICTVGVVPTRAETGFGYLEVGADRSAELGVIDVRAVARFVEKPDRATAASYLDGGRHLWNAGMFFVRARRLLAEIAQRLPETARALEEVAAALTDGGAHAAAAVAARVYATLPAISIDHGVMEHASGVVTIPGDFGWSDVGSWDALAEIQPADAEGDVIVGEAVVIDGGRNIVVTDPGTVVALVGVTDLVVVRSGNAILVVPRSRVQDVRAAVDALGERGLDRFL